MKSRWLRALIIVFVTYISLALITNFLEQQFVFQGVKLNDGHRFDFAIPFDSDYVKSDDGTKLHYLHFYPDGAPLGRILYLHGNSKNLDHWGQFAKDFTSRGYEVVMPDYRGYGLSDGTPEEEQLYEDGILFWQKFMSSYDCKKIILGRSLGSGVACSIAEKKTTDLLILETPITTLREIVLAQNPLGFFPFQLKNKFDNISKIKSITSPIYVIQGDKDRVTPMEAVKQLEPLVEKNGQFYTIEGGGHKNLNQFRSYHKVLDQILK